MSPHLGNRAATIWLAIVVLAAVFAPVLATHDPRQPTADLLSPPRPSALLGTDALGRDLWSRLLFGGRLSLSASLLACLAAAGVGGLAGLAAATYRGRVEALILFIANASLAVPGLLLALLLVAGFGPGLMAVVMAVGLSGIPGFARVARTLFLQIKEAEFVDASAALGGDLPWIATRHLLPNARASLATLLATQFAWAFMGTTTLTFLGLAGDPSLPEWGAMLNAGRADLAVTPWPALFPGLAIASTILAFYSLSEWLGRPKRDTTRHLTRSTES
jgi:peptide/nickel transport system permease protein